MNKPTLYAIPFACSFAAHVALVETGLEHQLVWVRRRSRAVGTYDPDFKAVNPKAKVPALRLSNDTCVTENIAVLLAIADLRPETGLAPAAGTPQRVALYEWLSFIATELHKQVLSACFDPATPAEMKAHVVTHLPALLEHVETGLQRDRFLVGNRFTVADAYLAWVMLLLPQLGTQLSPALATVLATSIARPSVRTVLDIERGIAEL